MEMEHGPLISDVMTRSVQVIAADADFSDAAEMMKKQSIHHLPVIKDGSVVGVLTEQDIKTVSALYGRLGPRTELTAEDVASTDIYIASPDTPLEEIAEQLVRKHVSAAIIAEGGKVQGIFTLSDACRWLARLFETSDKR